MRDEASPSGRPDGALPAAGVLPPSGALPPTRVPGPLALRPPLGLRIGASVALGVLVGVLGAALVVPAVLGRPDAPGPLPSATAVVVSIAAVAMIVGAWRVRLTASSDAVTRVRLFSDARTITRDDARRIEVSTALEPVDGPDGPDAPGGSGGSILPTIVLTGRSDATITSRENRREADVLLPHLLAWSRARPELVKDAHTLRFLTAYGRTTH